MYPILHFFKKKNEHLDSLQKHGQEEFKAPEAPKALKRLFSKDEKYCWSLKFLQYLLFWINEPLEFPKKNTTGAFF